LAQGLANVAGGLFHALPSGESLSRTGVSVSSGARSRWAGVASCVLLVIIVAVAGKVAELIPLTTLAAILMVIGVEALVREVRHLARARWVSVPHLCAAVVTVVVGVVAELTAAIVTGVALSLLLYVFTWPTRPGSSPGFDGPTGAGRRPLHQPSCPRGRSQCWR
jgi:SulP family sulfate permease